MTTANWNDVYMRWQYLLSEIPLSLKNMFTFHEVTGYSPPSQYPYEGIGWWPNDEFGELESALADENVNFGEPVNRGSLHTASMLSKNSSNLEAQSAIWIAGSVWNKRHALPKEWQGETHQLLSDIYMTIQNEFPQLPMWHHTVRRTLPFSITDRLLRVEIKVGNKVDNLLYLIAIEAAVINGGWKLVKIIPRQ